MSPDLGIRIGQSAGASIFVPRTHVRISIVPPNPEAVGLLLEAAQAGKRLIPNGQ